MNNRILSSWLVSSGQVSMSRITNSMIPEVFIDLSVLWNAWFFSTDMYIHLSANYESPSWISGDHPSRVTCSDLSQGHPNWWFSRWVSNPENLGGGFKYFFILTLIWGRFPFWIFFQKGWNHQLGMPLIQTIWTPESLLVSCLFFHRPDDPPTWSLYQTVSFSKIFSSWTTAEFAGSISLQVKSLSFHEKMLTMMSSCGLLAKKAPGIRSCRSLNNSKPSVPSKPVVFSCL